MRRTKPEKREVTPDIRYQSVLVQAFINRIMRKGKKSLATRMMYDAMDIVRDRTKRDPLEVVELAVRNVSPVMEVRPRRVGGATYQVPMEVAEDRRLTLALRWMLSAARSRPGKSFAEKLSAEILDASNNQGSAVRKREETHKMAEANRAFSHFRF
jgi:small subunit ribosomal protein S7